MSEHECRMFKNGECTSCGKPVENVQHNIWKERALLAENKCRSLGQEVIELKKDMRFMQEKIEGLTLKIVENWVEKSKGVMKMDNGTIVEDLNHQLKRVSEVQDEAIEEMKASQRAVEKLNSKLQTQKIAIICTATSLRKNYPEDTYLAGIASLLDSVVKETSE